METINNFKSIFDFKKPTVSISLGMNLDKWNSFDNEAKSIIEYACQSENQEMLSDFMYKEVVALEKLRSLGVEFRQLPNDIVIEAKKNINGVLDNYTDTSLGKKIRDDYFQFLGLRTSYKDFDISNYLNFRKI